MSASMKLTQATEEQQKDVAAMINKMINPIVKPVDLSFTLGWDVVASYSEGHINKLLETRHASDQGQMLRDIDVPTAYWDARTKKNYPCNYKLKFGPPLLQFNARAIGEPMCSLEMAILSGTEQYGDDKPTNVDPGWKLRLNNIPLASARGQMVDGKVDGTPDIVPGSKAVEFRYDNEQQHVVLGFHMDESKVVVTAIPPPNVDPESGPYQKTDFQEKFKKFFTGDGHRSLSYSIACVNNNTAQDVTTDLQPSKFQFVTCASGVAGEDDDLRVLSILIAVKGGGNTATSEDLQSRWQAQWSNNKAAPIPKGFTASLILSSVLVHKALLAPGFKKSDWDISNISPSEKALNKIEAKNSTSWTVPEQNIDYDITSKFHIDGFTVDLSKWPMVLELRQEDASKSLKAYAYWKIQQRVEWKATGKFLGLDTKWDNGSLGLTYTLCNPEEKKHYEPRSLDCKIELNDEAFNLDLQLDPKSFRMDQSEPNQIKYDTWRKGMEDLWTKFPEVKISSVGLGFLRTTNLLTPDKAAIDFNEAIGLKAPKDFVLVGDLIQA